MHNFRIIFSKKLTLVFCLGMAVALFFAGCATQDSGLKTGVADIDPSPSVEITAIGLSDETDIDWPRMFPTMWSKTAIR
jgi:uncharacterized lipoprotein YajG